MDLRQQHLAVKWVTQVARSLRPRNASELEEYVSAGLVGLARAMKTWDPTKGRLTTWSWMPIRAAIVEHLRRTDPNWQTKGRKPKSRVSIVSLDEVQDCIGEFVAADEPRDTDPPDEQYLIGLPPKTRAVMRWLYWEGLTQREIGKRLRVSQACVSMHKTKGLRLIRDRLQESAKWHETPISSQKQRMEARK